MKRKRKMIGWLPTHFLLREDDIAPVLKNFNNQQEYLRFIESVTFKAGSALLKMMNEQPAHIKSKIQNEQIISNQHMARIGGTKLFTAIRECNGRFLHMTLEEKLLFISLGLSQLKTPLNAYEIKTFDDIEVSQDTFNNTKITELNERVLKSNSFDANKFSQLDSKIIIAGMSILYNRVACFALGGEELLTFTCDREFILRVLEPSTCHRFFLTIVEEFRKFSLELEHNLWLIEPTFASSFVDILMRSR